MIRALLLLLLLPRVLWAEEVTVFAAASLKTALEEIAEAFEAETGHTVTLSFAGSSVLARQISFGAPADLFISANTAWMDHLEGQALLVPQTRTDIASNRLALISFDGKIHWAPGDPLPPGRIAMALVEAVPAGIYGKQALTHLNLWPDAAPRAVQTDNVRAALALTALGEAALGVVYASDAMAEPNVHLLAIFPEDSHDPIRYPAALIRDTEAARAFLDHLSSAEAQTVLQDAGFTPVAAQ